MKSSNKGNSTTKVGTVTGKTHSNPWNDENGKTKDGNTYRDLGYLCLIDPQGREMEITDYTEGLSLDRVRALMDKGTLLRMAEIALQSGSIDDIISNFLVKVTQIHTSIIDDDSTKKVKFLELLESELAFHKFIEAVNNEPQVIRTDEKSSIKETRSHDEDIFGDDDDLKA